MASDVHPRAGNRVRVSGRLLTVLIVAFLTLVVQTHRGMAAEYAALVMDARTGEVLHSRNADARLHPASLTKMMTLYIVFEAVEHGEISLDSEVRVSRQAASEPPSKLGLREGQKIKLRYLIRAAAVKSANDAATALAEAIEGSEAAFARRMNRTAKAIGMTRTTFKNAHGLTESGHLSTARDMTILGRQLFYDFPEYYNLFSRQTADAGIARVSHTNTRFLNSYRGADGIKTGFTSAAGFNLTASAVRGGERIIATVFGGRSTASRNEEVARLLDLGFQRAPSRVAVAKPRRPAYQGAVDGDAVVLAASAPAPAGPTSKTIRLKIVVAKSPIPRARPTPGADVPDEVVLALSADILEAVSAEQEQAARLAAAQAAQAATEAAIAGLEQDDAATVFAEAVPVPPLRPETATNNVASEEIAEGDAVLVADSTPAIPPVTTVVPTPRPADLQLASVEPTAARASTATPSGTEIVTRMSSSGDRHWGITVGTYGTEFEAERVLLKTALAELSTLDGALRKVVRSSRGFNANFLGLTQETADLACRRLQSRGSECATIGPS